MEPEIGDRDVCTWCGREIEFQGTHWTHTDKDYEHAAVPVGKRFEPPIIVGDTGVQGDIIFTDESGSENWNFVPKDLNDAQR